MSLKLMYNSHGDFDKYMRKFEQYCRQLEEAEQPLTESQKRQIFLKGIEDRYNLANKDLCDTGIYMKTIHQLRKNAVQMNKSGQTRSKQYCRVNKMHRNGGTPEMEIIEIL